MTRNLSYGCQGEDVRALQKQLADLGYYSGTLDGDFGPVTDAAVRAFQTASGIYVDGIVGPVTRGVLEAKKEPEVPPEDTIKSARRALQAGNGSVEVGRWRDHIFNISNQQIRSFQNLQITGSADIEKADDNDQSYFSYKGAAPYEIHLTAVYSAFLGCDVKGEACWWTYDTVHGCTGPLYIGGKKLVDYDLLLSDAKISKIEFAPDMTWTYAEVALTFKQCSTEGLGAVKDTSSSSSGGSSGSGGDGYSGGGGGYSGGGGGGYSGGSNKVSIKKSGVKKTTDTIFQDNTIPNNWVGGNASASASNMIFTAKIKNGNNDSRGLQGSLNSRSSNKTTTVKVTNTSSSSRRISGTVK